MAVPKRLQFAIRNFSIDQSAVLDVGCGRGDYLQYFGTGSTGLDLDPGVALKRGLHAHAWNFTDEVPTDLRKGFDAIWCSNLLEHVLAPHEFLINLRAAARPQANLFVVVPNTTPYQGRSWRGHLAADHINFFNPRTLRLTVSRAGYEVVFVGAPSVPWLHMSTAELLGPFAPVLLCVARVDLDFQYPDKAHKRLDHGRIRWKSSA